MGKSQQWFLHVAIGNSIQQGPKLEILPLENNFFDLIINACTYQFTHCLKLHNSGEVTHMSKTFALPFVYVKFA